MRKGLELLNKKEVGKKVEKQGLLLSKRPKERRLILLMRTLPLKEGVLDIVLSITSGKGLHGIKNNNDRNYLEL
jgi:hypothetical protein